MPKLLLSILFLLVTLVANGQNTVAEEVVKIDASSATVFCPFATNVTSKNNIDKSSFGIYLILVIIYTNDSG